MDINPPKSQNDSASHGTLDLLPHDHIDKISDQPVDSPPLISNKALSDKEN